MKIQPPVKRAPPLFDAADLYALILWGVRGAAVIVGAAVLGLAVRIFVAVSGIGGLW